MNLKTIPAIILCLAHNLLQLFHATRKTEAAIADTKVITAYHKDLDRREAKAKASGRAFPKALYQAFYRPTELSLQFLRWITVPSRASELLRASPRPPTPPYGAILIGISWTGFAQRPSLSPRQSPEKPAQVALWRWPRSVGLRQTVGPWRLRLAAADRARRLTDPGVRIAPAHLLNWRLFGPKQ